MLSQADDAQCFFACVDNAQDLAVAQLKDGLVDCSQCGTRHKPYECPDLKPMTVDQQREFFRKKGQRRREERKANVRQVTVDVDEYIPALAERNISQHDSDDSSSSSEGDVSFSGINNLDFQAGDW